MNKTLLTAQSYTFLSQSFRYMFKFKKRANNVCINVFRKNILAESFLKMFLMTSNILRQNWKLKTSLINKWIIPPPLAVFYT